MRRPPPWWPEGEPFPPARGWSRRRGYGPPPFMRFVGCFVLVVLGVSLLTGALAGAAFRAGVGFHPFFAFPLLLILALIAIAVFGGVRRVAAPLNDLIEAARRVESGDYSARVPETGSDDVRSVAHAFNSMSARLKSIDEQRRSFLADVAHELRTPLSVIRGQAEAIADGVYPGDAAHLAPILDATQTLDRLVEDLRTLVLTDAGNLVLHREPADLGALIHDAVDSFRAQAQNAGVALSAETAASPSVLVDPSRIRQVIGNLLSNALRHTPSGGSVTVVVSAPADITVSDTGEGIQPELLPHVFERFAKGAESTGSGLGLAIAHDIVTAHGGTIAIENASPHGTVVRIKLPA